MARTNFAGTFVLDRSENFEEFMKKNGLGFMFRKVANKTKPTIEVTQDENSITWKTISTFFTQSTTFAFGEETEEKQADGNTMKVTVTWDGDKLLTHYEPKEPGKGKSQRTTREMAGDEIIVTMYLEDVVAKRIYKRK